MNWEAVAAVGEIAGAAAVVISIVYLSIQIRSNTRATRASASYEASHSFAQFNERMMTVPDEILALCLRSDDPDARIEDFSDVEYLRLVAMHRTIFQRLEGQYYLYSYGSLDPGVWENRRRMSKGIIELPLYRAWWENESKFGMYSDAFVQALEATTPTDAKRVLRKPSATESNISSAQ